MNVSKTLAIAGLLAGMMTAPSLMANADAHDGGPGNSKHYYCYDKHGRWRSHPHCPAPQPSVQRHYAYREPYRGRYAPHYSDARDRYQRRPQVIYVRKDAPYDYRGRAPLNDSLKTKSDARQAVQQSRDQLRSDRAELKNDRAELRRDIRNRASKEEIRADRQEIRADLQKMKSTRQDLRSDRRELTKR